MEFLRTLTELAAVPAIQSVLLVMATIGVICVQVGVLLAGGDKVMVYTAFGLLFVYMCKTISGLPKELREIQNADDPSPTNDVPEA
jgi:uncharacterized membrane protein YjjP (DUF1212 family)